MKNGIFYIAIVGLLSCSNVQTKKEKPKIKVAPTQKRSLKDSLLHSVGLQRYSAYMGSSCKSVAYLENGNLTNGGCDMAVYEILCFQKKEVLIYQLIENNCIPESFSNEEIISKRKFEYSTEKNKIIIKNYELSPLLKKGESLYGSNPKKAKPIIFKKEN